MLSSAENFSHLERYKMSSCCEKPSENSRCGHTDSTNEQSDSGLPGVFSKLSPVIPALLHSSCCWLPVIHYPLKLRCQPLCSSFANPESFPSQAVLDFLSIGSASISIFQRFRSVFLVLTLLILGWDIYNRGLTKRNLGRIALSALFLSWPHLSSVIRQPDTHGTHHKSCH